MDFLAHLIERTTALEAAVQPLLRPMYAPDQGGAAGAEWDETAEEVETAPSPPAPRVRQRRASVVDVPQLERPPQPAAPRQVAPEARETPEPPIARAVVPSASTPAYPMAAQEEPLMPLQPPPPRPTTVTQESSKTEERRTARRREEVSADEPARRRDDRLLVPEGVPSRKPADIRPVPVPDAKGRTEPPVVRVTIGRIEVRAAPPPAPMPSIPMAPPAAEARPGPAGPRLSLDEYLRNGGRG